MKHRGDGGIGNHLGNRAADDLVRRAFERGGGRGVDRVDVAPFVHGDDAVRGGVDNGVIAKRRGLLIPCRQGNGLGVLDGGGNVLIRSPDFDEGQPQPLRDLLGDASAHDDLDPLLMALYDDLFQAGLVLIDLLDEFDLE